MAENWYVILELEFDPPVEDEKKIADKIDERAKFWSTHFNDFKMGAQYRAWHQNIPKIKKDMIGPANIRKQLATDACTEIYGPIDKLLKTIGRKGYINNVEGDKLAKSKKVSVDVVKKRAAKLGIEWKVETVDYQAIYDKYYKTKPQNASAFDGMKQMLSSFNVDNLYDFLYANTTVKNANRLPCETLRQRATEKKKTEFYKNDSISGTGSKLCGQCELAFKDDNSKDVYDKYLEYAKRKSILDDAKSVADISGELSIEQGDEIIGQLTQIFRDRKLAEDVLVAFCKIEKISYNASATTGTTTKNLKVCRCGCINDVSDGRKVCSNCGLELEIKCPKCGNTNDANIKVCKCGFKFEDIDKALALCEQAEQAIDTLDFSIAKAHLSDASRYWPNSAKVKSLNEKLSEFEQRVGKEVSKMRDAIKEKRYFEARNQYSIIKKLFSGYSDAFIEQEISQAITKAQSLFNQAKVAKVEKDILDLCAQAYDICSDLPGVKELMPAPPVVVGMTIDKNSFSRTNTISWTSNNDKSIRYVLVRSKNGWIQHVTDGEIIFRGSANSYSDKSISPGVTYYYNVFAERAGIYSKASKGETAVNLFEISNVSVIAADSSLNITWDGLPENATAEIYEISSSGRKLIATSSSDCYLVSGLTNGNSYSYHILLSYMVNGKKEVTKGFQKSGVPDCPPEPIDTLRIKSSQNDIFEATWFQKGTNDVRLFCSTQKPKYNVGDLIPLSNLEQEMRPLQQRPLAAQAMQSLKSNEKGASFQYSGTELLYVVAVVVKSGSAVFGSLARASKGENVNIKAIRPVNGQINIYLDAPKTATGFVVLYRFDKFPTDIGDVQTVRKYVPLKQYQLNSAIVLDNLESKKYYFSVFAEFKRDGEKDYSSGSDYLFDNAKRENITYSISVNKKLFGESNVILEFEAESKEFELPAIEVMSATGNTPMFKASAKLFHSIPEQHVNGSLQVKIPLPKGLAKETYIKAFFKDESAQAGNQLRLKLKSNYKIN